MSLSLKEYDYIASSQPNMEKITQNQHLNLKATELRLGLPGSESPERTTITVAGALKKRGFSDTINTPSETWVFSENGGSDPDFVKNGAFFSSSSSSSPRGENKNPDSSKLETLVSPSSNHSLLHKHPQFSASKTQHSSKAQVVGWPPIRSFRKNSMAAKNTKNEDDTNAESGSNCVYVKVSMDGAPYLRKVDLKIYSSYLDLSLALEKMFSSFTLGHFLGILMYRSDIFLLDNDVLKPDKGQKGEGLTESPFMALLNGSEYVLTYEDKDGDLMLVGDVPWDMFTGTCKRMRIMKSSDAIGLAPRAMEKPKIHI